MKPVQVCESKDESQNERSALSCCCFCAKKSASLNSLDSKINEPYEYVVEKLVIKRVPIKKFTPDEEIASKLRIFNSDTSPKSDGTKKSIITFSSYCQMVPPPRSLIKKTESEVLKSAIKENLDDETPPKGNQFQISGSPKEEMTTGRRQQLQKCILENWTTAQVHTPIASKNLQNSIYSEKNSPTTVPTHSPIASRNLQNLTYSAKTSPALSKIAPSRENLSVVTTTNNTLEVDPALQETIALLAKKKPAPSLNRRLVQRDPATGQIKEMFKNTEIEPFKLDEIYAEDKKCVKTNAVSEGSCGCGDHDSSKSSPQSSLKWKIIIKHHKKDVQENPVTTSEYVTDTDI